MNNLNRIQNMKIIGIILMKHKLKIVSKGEAANSRDMER